MIAAPPGCTWVDVTRHGPNGPQDQADHVIDECPVAIVVNGVSHVVMMATPLQVDDLAVGFMLSEGLLHHIDELRDIDVRGHTLGLEVHLDVSPRAHDRLQQQRRQLAGRTGCGLCGIESLQAFHAGLPEAGPGGAVPAALPLPDAGQMPELIARALSRLPTAQALQQQTGGCHAAAWVDASGGLTLVREDVGRHNALDKLIGARAREAAGDGAGFAMVSSRASYEMAAKCVRTGIGGLAAISAPTSLAIDLARRHGLRLWGFCRPGSVVAYA